MTAVKYDVTMVPVCEVYASHNRRAIDSAAVDRLAESIKKIGLQTPITVRIDRDYADPETGEIIGGFPLIAGGHRLEAYRRLGRDDIPAIVRDCDEIDARLWEISENLDRVDLTVLERKEQEAEWIGLMDGKLQNSQVAKNESKRSDGRGHRQEGGVNAASRELGISKDQAYRAVDIAKLPEAVKEAARNNNLDDNQSALLAAVKAARKAEKEGADATAAAVSEIESIAKKKASKPLRKPITADRALEKIASDILSGTSVIDTDQPATFADIKRVWDRMESADQLAFLKWAHKNVKDDFDPAKLWLARG